MKTLYQLRLLERGNPAGNFRTVAMHLPPALSFDVVVMLYRSEYNDHYSYPVAIYDVAQQCFCS